MTDALEFCVSALGEQQPDRTREVASTVRGANVQAARQLCMQQRLVERHLQAHR
jgi:hypothetical protein